MPQARVLLAAIFSVAACGLVYELLIATVSSYLLGSSVTQFSLAIGVFIGSMGLGSHLSQYVDARLLSAFILAEVALGLLGGVSVTLLLWSFSAGPLYWLVLYGCLIAIGSLVGLELPLLTRTLNRFGTLKTAIAQALSYDYVGALAGSVLFPLLLLPMLGMTRTAFLMGLVNVAVAGWVALRFRDELPAWRKLLAACGASAAVLAMGFLGSLKLVSLLESRLYEDEIVFAKQTPYQRIVLTRWGADLRLFLDGNLQFASVDEYRYHEALVHPAASLAARLEEVLVLGGGDGLGVREILKHAGVGRVTLVDLDPEMTRLGSTYPAITTLNAGALSDPRVRIVHEDAQKFLEREATLYDLIVVDLPDPNNEALSRLYSVEFYRLARRHLSAAGALVTQATSPYFARQAFWCIVRTMETAGLKTAPYHAYVPSFGDWGFVLASARALPKDKPALKIATRFLNEDLLARMFTWSKDDAPVPVEPSTMDKPSILRYYLRGWKQWQ
ncbi:MAG: polyamine aminopropyltransferase [Proteobacteria bacterium]|nr:polyamine aminopropyltransferase [Pseudomonadota bacterium]